MREASRICGMSESHFMSFFKRVTGLSFMKYLNHYRVERSQVLLVNTDEPMASISQEMGFCDQSYFGTVFRRLVGMTPAAYRRRFRDQKGSGRGQISSAPPIWPAKASLTGAPQPSTTEINRQLAALHGKPVSIRPTSTNPGSEALGFPRKCNRTYFRDPTVGHPPLLGRKSCSQKRNCRSLHYAPPDFLLGLVALASFMRLSEKKTA